jgi:mannose-6-phosphate isomerase-like protein (cupin superfamily)
MKFLFFVAIVPILFGNIRATASVEVITGKVPEGLDMFCYVALDDLKRNRPIFKPLLILALAKGLKPEVHGGDGDGEKYEIRRLGVRDNQAYEIESRGYFYFATGTGIITLKDKAFRYQAGDQFNIAPGLLHGFSTETKTVFLSINDPPILDEETGKVDIDFK